MELSNSIEKDQIKNWKLLEVKDQIEIIHNDSIFYRDNLLKDIGIPIVNDLTGLNRSETLIDWSKMNSYYSFYFDNEGIEESIRNLLFNSNLKEADSVVIIYGWKEPAIKIATRSFIEDWEGFVRSTQWETIILSEDFRSIIEVSRDYYMHSNFPIMNYTCS